MRAIFFGKSTRIMTKLVIFTLLSLTATAWGYSSGAPEAVCSDMTPKHPFEPQKSDMLHKVTIDKTECKPGEEVKISISGKPFKGFFLQVRNGEGNAVGSFDVAENDKYFKTTNCHGTKGSAVTHKNSVEKKDVTVTWKAPEKAGKYTVYATVVEDGSIFWVHKPSGTIKVE